MLDLDGAREKLKSRGSSTAIAALDALHAAMWLFAVDEVPQSLIAVHHATELALKGLLEEVDLALTDRELTDWRNHESEDYNSLKHLLAPRFRVHDLARAVPIPDRASLNDARYGKVSTKHRSRPPAYDPQQTICFMQAVTRVGEMLTLGISGAKLQSFNETRNEIVHSGADPSRVGIYLSTLLDDALPFLANFYLRAYSIALNRLVGPDIARELLEVAPAFLREAPQAKRSTVLYTFRHAWFWTYRHEPGRTIYLDERPVGKERSDDGSQWDRYEFYLQQFQGRFSSCYTFPHMSGCEILCRICGEPCLVATSDELREGNSGGFFLDADAVHCPGCGLEIPPNGGERNQAQSTLAALHVGPINEETVGADGWQRVLRDLRD